MEDRDKMMEVFRVISKIGAIALFLYYDIKALKCHNKRETIEAIYFLAWAIIMYIAAIYR